VILSSVNQRSILFPVTGITREHTLLTNELRYSVASSQSLRSGEAIALGVVGAQGHDGTRSASGDEKGNRQYDQRRQLAFPRR
jgi:hypothetical protein